MRRQQPPSHTAAASVPTRSGYDWSRFGRHRLRAPATVLIDSPVGFDARSWLATLWPQSGSEPGWARMLWEPEPSHGAGWVVAERLAGGEVIEFGADRPGCPVRWYGLIDSYDAVEWLTVQGPYSDSQAAYDHAQALLAYQPPLHVATARWPCTRRQHRRRP